MKVQPQLTLDPSDTIGIERQIADLFHIFDAKKEIPVQGGTVTREQFLQTHLDIARTELTALARQAFAKGMEYQRMLTEHK